MKSLVLASIPLGLSIFVVSLTAGVVYAILAILFLILLAIAVYLDARLGMHFTFLSETDIAFVVRGGEIHKVLIGLEDGGRREEDEKEEGKQVKQEDASKEIRANLKARGIKLSSRSTSKLAKWFGIHYVSLLYPLFKLHKFEILAAGLKDGSEGKETPKEGSLMREWLYRRNKEVDALWWKIPRPILVENVELADRTTIDIIVMTVLEVQDPYIPVFTLRGDFFGVVETLVQSATIDTVVGEPKDLTYPEFVNMNKGEASDFSDDLQRKINGEGERKGLAQTTGIKVEKAYVTKYDLSKDQKEIQDAAREESLQKMKALGTIAKARGDAEARIINAEAEAVRFKTITQALKEAGVGADKAADVARTLVRTENVRDSKITTWVDAEGGIGSIAGK